MSKDTKIILAVNVVTLVLIVAMLIVDYLRFWPVK